MRTSISFSLGSKRGSVSVTSVHNYAIAIQKARDFRIPTSKIRPQYPSKSHDFKKGALRPKSHKGVSNNISSPID